MGKYCDLSREDLIRLQEMSVDALQVTSQSELDAYIQSFSDVFPVEQMAIVSFCYHDVGWRLLALHNRGFPPEREREFLKNDRLSACDVVSADGDIDVRQWRLGEQAEGSTIGLDAARYGVESGLYGIIKPRHDLVGVLCSLAGPSVADHTRLSAFLKAWLPHFQIAQTRALVGRHPPPQTDIELTPREYDVLRWLCSGKTNWEISRILDISESTVKFHVANLTQKLGASNRTHIVAMAGPVLASHRYRLAGESC